MTLKSRSLYLNFGPTDLRNFWFHRVVQCSKSKDSMVHGNIMCLCLLAYYQFQVKYKDKRTPKSPHKNLTFIDGGPARTVRNRSKKLWLVSNLALFSIDPLVQVCYGFLKLFQSSKSKPPLMCLLVDWGVDATPTGRSGIISELGTGRRLPQLSAWTSRVASLWKLTRPAEIRISLVNKIGQSRE